MKQSTHKETQQLRATITREQLWQLRQLASNIHMTLPDFLGDLLTTLLKEVITGTRNDSSPSGDSDGH